MTKLCEFCDEPFIDGEDIGFIAHGDYKQLSSQIAYAIGKEFTIDGLYHRECLNYVIGGGK